MESEIILKKQKEFFLSGKTKDINFRIQYLKKLKDVIAFYEHDILDALKKDLNKSNFEAYETELGMVLEEITLMIKKARYWCKSERKRTSIVHFKTSSKIYKEPYGVVLNISPWNYPFQLSMIPLIGAVAAGNCVMLKPSKYSIHTSDVIEKIICETFPEEYVSVVEKNGGRSELSNLLDLKFDFIFFTGGAAMGSIVMEKASRYLTPVTLELGGKSPCIVHKDADLRKASKRIVWGKFLNAGQTCVAPDYLMVHEAVKEELISYMIQDIKSFFGEEPFVSEDYGRIINEIQFNRLTEYLREGNIIFGGDYDTAQRYISPTLIDEVSFTNKIMRDEIFGPIMPIIEYKDINTMIKRLQNSHKSLALYLFTEDNNVEKNIIDNVSFGGGCVNDTIIHVSSSYVPFGGVGNSGIGSYHGKWSCDLFTHKKTVLKKTTMFDIDFRYPPYSDNKLKWLKKLLK
ncbi:aldehyde dehydrogenase (NAD+) [Hathewaya proteolytica DSM 3090]|uniref:Aldehyde dehydrogenase n=1 Tax=Hathewaya proteolytica DSM 3090 TaxID=1121331 RepID=A0A1M6QCR8_9CLOT|nr:aldehyde dehydrogenase [Hathewaya proteolytica]SHK17968.1 aldehyde dehydrogenase (NAD+) [Hathewaya proteolytica DSM 3090]